jgi:hypothetical protein
MVSSWKLESMQVYVLEIELGRKLARWGSGWMYWKWRLL